jgi:hypothetical protein
MISKPVFSPPLSHSSRRHLPLLSPASTAPPAASSARAAWAEHLRCPPAPPVPRGPAPPAPAAADPAPLCSGRRHLLSLPPALSLLLSSSQQPRARTPPWTAPCSSAPTPGRPGPLDPRAWPLAEVGRALLLRSVVVPSPCRPRPLLAPRAPTAALLPVLHGVPPPNRRHDHRRACSR